MDRKIGTAKINGPISAKHTASGAPAESAAWCAVGSFIFAVLIDRPFYFRGTNRSVHVFSWYWFISPHTASGAPADSAAWCAGFQHVSFFLFIYYFDLGLFIILIVFFCLSIILFMYYFDFRVSVCFMFPVYLLFWFWKLSMVECSLCAHKTCLGCRV